MFKRIVVPLDRTQYATAVLPTARALGAHTGATLALLHVVDRPLAYGTDLADEERRSARLWLGEVAQETPQDQTPITIAVRSGSPAEEILTYADEIEADLICMATHARAGIGRIVLGSVAERVIQEAHLPVLLVRQAVTTPDIPAHGSIVVPLDGSPRSEAALPYAVNLAKRLDASLTLVRVWKTAIPTIPGPYAIEMDQQLFVEMEEATEAFVTTYLANVAERLGDEVPIRTISLYGDTAEQLAAYLRKERPGLVVMGAHGRGGIPRWVMGSVANALVRTAVSPVLLISDACIRAAEQTTALAETIGTH